MADPDDLIEGYLNDLSTKVRRLGRNERRLLTELRDHLEDSMAAHVSLGASSRDAARRAIELTGSTATIAEDWASRRHRQRKRQRARAGTLIAGVAAATALAAAQHAQGRHTPPQRPCGAALPAVGTSGDCRHRH